MACRRLFLTQSFQIWRLGRQRLRRCESHERRSQTAPGHPLGRVTSYTADQRTLSLGGPITATLEDSRFTVPLYTVPEAARLVGMAPSTLATWAKGYTRRFSNRRDVEQGPVITCVPPGRPGWPTIPFVGLVEATVVQAFRRTELPLQRIRRALQVLAEQGELAHPLASRRLYSDGARVLFDYATDAEDGQLRLLTVVDGGQRVFHEVIAGYLERIHFADPWATELIVPVTDRPVLRVLPRVAFGDPLFINGGAPLSAVISRYRAGEAVKSLASDYEVPADDIREALRGVGVTAKAA